jgi:sirohydrochlorin cobaltochelatase
MVAARSCAVPREPGHGAGFLVFGPFPRVLGVGLLGSALRVAKAVLFVGRWEAAAGKRLRPALETGPMRDSNPASGASRALVLVSHGGVPNDMPRSLLKEMRQLHAAAHGQGASSEESRKRADELEVKVRTWPRTPESDPYQAGVESLGRELVRVLPHDTKLVLAYNEFCAPSIQDAIADLVGEGIATIDVVTTMMTPGGSHSERDIPQALDAARARFPGVRIDYLWPYDMADLARMVAAQLSAKRSEA